MTEKDSFYTIKSRGEGLYRDRGSKFIAYLFPCSAEQECMNALEQIKKEHPKARHHCFAYRLGVDGAIFRVSDDGEPGGTAGKPILGQLVKHNLTAVMAIVVRYFGGTLLGKSGLIQAYKGSTSIAIENVSIIKKVVEQVVEIAFPYALMSSVMQAVKKERVTIVHQDFSLEPSLHIALRTSETNDKLFSLKARILRKHLEEIESLEPEEGLSFRLLFTRSS